MRTLLGILFVLHGIITASQSNGMFQHKESKPNQLSLQWWPNKFGQAWILDNIVNSNNIIRIIFGVFWLLSGAILLFAGLGLLNILIPQQLWRTFAFIGSSISIVLLIVFLHPLYSIGLLSNIGILIVLLWIGWPKL
jgi:hypothetical protein